MSSREKSNFSVETRSQNGGLRTGCMERDCLACQGLPACLKDRLMEQSDEFRFYVCDICGLIAEEGMGRKECKVCETKKVSRVRIPYGAKLVIQELAAMNIVCRILTSPFSEEERKFSKVQPLSCRSP